MAVINVTGDAFKSTVIESDKPVLVDFWAEWCGPCKKLGPILEQVAEEIGDRAIVAKVDVEAERNLAAYFQVMSIPTVMFFKGGEKVGEFIGVKSKDELLTKLNSLLD